MIFSELYSVYYQVVAEIIGEAISRPLQQNEINNIIKTHAFGETVLTIEPSLSECRWQLLKPDGTTIIQNVPKRPMTTLEKRWLKSISLDPRIRLFTEGEEEIWENFPEEPLFTPEDYEVFDRYLDGDPYTEEHYIRNFRQILSAIKNQNLLRIESYNHKGKKIRTEMLPEYLEYSEKDDKFRLTGTNQHLGVTVNLGRIISCEQFESEDKKVFTKRILPKKRRVIFELVDERDALERVLLHFAHFEKQAERLDDNRYKITLDYNKDDETEVLIRILSFGPYLKVTAPEHFINLIKDRLTRQKSCEQ